MAKKNSYKGKSCNQYHSVRYVSTVLGFCVPYPQNPLNLRYFSECGVPFTCSRVHACCVSDTRLLIMVEQKGTKLGDSNETEACFSLCDVQGHPHSSLCANNFDMLTFTCQHTILSHGPDCLDTCSTSRLHRNHKVHLSPPFNYWLYFAWNPSAVGVVGWWRLGLRHCAKIRPVLG